LNKTDRLGFEKILNARFKFNSLVDFRLSTR